jgi:hypothetical protein
MFIACCRSLLARSNVHEPSFLNAVPRWCRNGKVDQGLLDQMFQHFLSVEHLPKMAQAAKPVDTVGVIIQRHVDTGPSGMTYMKWMLSGMLRDSMYLVQS